MAWFNSGWWDAGFGIAKAIGGAAIVAGGIVIIAAGVSTASIPEEQL